MSLSTTERWQKNATACAKDASTGASARADEGATEVRRRWPFMPTRQRAELLVAVRKFMDDELRSRLLACSKRQE